ncbi:MULTISPECIES: hypothetical protein [unclassified Thermosipho (in: thermotogales)]|uniref:hypothetical protein n=1 Tax=unclassified Thermosipho (in: thermotogales) TaxID=2676525 RepID=UPI0009494A0D|nr:MULTISPECIES: hypothetical protein [unclassified Thermosipho (in: thermotogales)]ANQ54468.1 hypothetical protein Y592_08825 [Thermosipho sp. 1070]APT72910.1 hypothetical protein BG95_08720 [Thermosipho sp. 1063]MBT1247845.1 hypothetical protein [Thermosipho sp. 1244]OOC42352.1 hypothetical protein XO08_08775 [Thermosipho sp. 1074]OOC45454.1 hypothetical protein XO09_08775 [Thermosipho sp. 1223]
MENKKLKEYNITWERYEKALSKVLSNFANSGIETVTVEEIWVETSLPIDLILEILERNKLNYPEEIKEIKYKNEIIWSRNEK